MQRGKNEFIRSMLSKLRALQTNTQTNAIENIIVFVAGKCNRRLRTMTSSKCVYVSFIMSVCVLSFVGAYRVFGPISYRLSRTG